MQSRWLTRAVLAVVVSSHVGSMGASPGRAQNHDAFLAAETNVPLTVDTGWLVERQLSVAHQEPRLGVPSFLWATEPRPPLRKAAPEDAARAHLRGLGELYRLTPEHLDELSLTQLHRPSFGPFIARFGQSVHGIPVFRNQLNVVMSQRLELVAVSGHLAPSPLLTHAEGIPVNVAFRASPQSALARAFAALTGTQLSPEDFEVAGDSPGGYLPFRLDDRAALASGYGVVSTPRARRVYFLLADRLEPAWYVEQVKVKV